MGESGGKKTSERKRELGRERGVRVPRGVKNRSEASFAGQKWKDSRIKKIIKKSGGKKARSVRGRRIRLGVKKEKLKKRRKRVEGGWK